MPQAFSFDFLRIAGSPKDFDKAAGGGFGGSCARHAAVAARWTFEFRSIISMIRSAW